MTAWRGTVVAHEREHEAGYNNCLASRRAQGMLADMEATVGHRSFVRNTLGRLWANFDAVLRSAGEAAGAAASDGFWLYNGGWRLGRYNEPPESGQSGC